MSSVVILQKSGNAITKSISDNATNLSSIVTCKGRGDFKIVHIWENSSYQLCLYAWTDGKSGTENKHEMPPPIDNELYFGDMIICKKIKNVFATYTVEDYEQFYEKQFGGFEDLDDTDGEDDESDDDSCEEDEDYNPDEDDDDDDDDDEDDEDENYDDDDDDEEDADCEDEDCDDEDANTNEQAHITINANDDDDVIRI